MGVFAYEAMNSSGQEVKDEIEAATPEEAISKIRSKGYFPTKVREKAQKKLAKKKGAAGDAAPLQKKRKMPISIGGVPRKAVGQFHPAALHAAGRRVCRSCAACKFWKTSRNPDFSKRSSAAWRTKSKAVGRSPMPWPNSPRPLTSFM